MSFDHLVVPRSFLGEGFSLKRRAQLAFSSNDKVKAFADFWQARCDASCTRNHSFVRARREPLDGHVDVADKASDGVEPS